MENETNMSDVQDYLDDFWDTFSAEEKRDLERDGYHPTKTEVIRVDFTIGKVLERRFV